MPDFSVNKQQENLDALWEAAGAPDANQEDLNALWNAAISEPSYNERMSEVHRGLFYPTDEEKKARSEKFMPSGQTMGGFIGGLLGAPAGPVTAVPLAALGGAGGKAIEDIYNQYVNPEEASKSSQEAALKILKAGGEEAAYEVGGRVVGKVLGKVYHVARPKVAAGIEELQSLMKKYGGNFTAAERTESFLTQTVDSLVRGSLSGKGIMKQADDINEAALKAWQKDLSNTIASSAKENMPDSVFGNLVKDTLANGKAAFKGAMNEIYGSFDELVKTNIREGLLEKQVSSPIVDASGKPIQTTILEKVIEEVRPVDVRPLKNEAADLLAKLNRIQKIGLGDFGGETISKIFNLDDALRFSDAQTLRSTLLDISRKVADDPAEAKLAGSINRFASKITKAMDEAAEKQGPDIARAYKEIKRQAEKGYSSFNDNFIVNLMKDKTASERVGELLYKSGNESQIAAFRKALLRAARYDKSINPSKVWQQTQQKYMEALFKDNQRKIGIEAGETLAEFENKVGVIDATKMLDALQDAKKNRTFKAMITSSKQREDIINMVKAAAITQQKSVAGLSMLMQLSQGGVIVNMVSGAEGAAKKAATLFFPTSLMAKMMTNPNTIRLLTSAFKTPMSAKQAPIILSKLMIAYENEQAKENKEPKPIEKAIDIGKDMFKAL